MIFLSELRIVILLLSWTACASDPMGLSPSQKQMKQDWEDVEKHPPLERTEVESDFLNQILARPDDDYKARSEGPACLRREYRTLNDSSRRELHEAYNLMKKTVIDNATDGNLTEYNVFVAYHRRAMAPGAHFGPGFLGWHREFLLRFERALQRHNPNICLPYLDWTLDQGIPAPGESALWTSEYLGNHNGDVSIAFAANWTAYPQDCARKWPVVYRQVNQTEFAQMMLFNDTGINSTLQKERFQDICIPYDNRLEGYHGAVHVFIGGHMSLLACAPNDPTFFIHHCFIDFLFEEFRQKYQQSSLESDYPRDEFVPEYHHAEDRMMPFDNMTNIDGLNSNYTQLFYAYASRPNRCDEHENCQSEILWCNKASNRCTAKIREGGRCEEFPDEACYSTKCKKPKNVNGFCHCPND